MKLFNPVLRNEQKTTERSIKFPIMITLYVLILSVVAILIYKNNLDSSYYSGAYPQWGSELYGTIAMVQAFILMFVVPSMTSTAITGEREKQTLDVLLSTKMTPLAIIIGKLVSSINKVIILILCSLPIYTLCSFIGGINILNILELGLFFIITTIFAGSIGILVSTYVKNSRVSTVITYTIILLVYLVLVIGISIYMTSKLMYGATSPQDIGIPILGYLSPTMGLIGLIVRQTGTLPLMGGLLMGGMYDMSTGMNAIYIISIIVQIAISVICILLAARKLNPLKSKTK